MKRSLKVHKSAYQHVLAFVLSIFTVTYSYGQQQEPISQPDLETDRPDQTEAASVVPVGTFQIESGLYFQRDKNGSFKSTYLAMPTALLRVGVLHWLELRAEGTYQHYNATIEEETAKERGTGPLTLGAKTKLWEEKGIRPQAGAMVMVNLPVGHSTFVPDEPQVNLRLMFKNSLNNKTNLNYNLALDREDGTMLPGYAVSVGRGLTDKIGMYAELYGEKPKAEKSSHNFDGGFVFLVAPNMQLDLAAGTQLFSKGTSYFITSGLSLRLPR
jgi:hypothetical protein